MTFEDTDYRYEFLDIDNPFDVKLVTEFLASQGYEYKPEEVDLTLILYNLNNEIIGTGSLRKQTLKFIVVAEEFRETTAFPLIVSYLTDKILENYKCCFVYTKPETAVAFKGLGFKEISRAEPLFVVLEYGYESIINYQRYLLANKVKTNTNIVAAIVVNCNPFTLGHLYLIEKAARENEVVYLFVVEEDLSCFPFEIRKKLIREGISHLHNVVMLTTGPYIVSGAIFPNYFLKLEKWDMITQKQAEMDAKIFAKYIVPTLGITKRYVGTENYCVITKAYNDAMKRILPDVGCKVVEIERKALGFGINNQPNYISASKVRKAIKENKLSDVIDFLPESTKKFLLSKSADSIIEKIKCANERH